MTAVVCTGPIVIVEDDDDIRETLRKVFVDQGYAVEVACNGQEALLLLERLKPCLMLVDLMMPVMDGFELLSRLGSAAGYPIYVSSSSPERAPPGFPVIAKPVDLLKLLKIVKSHCLRG